MQQHERVKHWGANVWGWVFILPQLLLLVVFYLTPLIKVCRDAFYYLDPFGLYMRFAGLHNFIDLCQDKRYMQALSTTCHLIVTIVPFTMALGLTIALVLQQVTRGRTAYKLLLLWPYAVSPAIAAILWRFILHPSSGWLSEFLAPLHMQFNYLMHPWQARLTITLVAIWQQLSYNILFFFVALEAIPHSLIEAAMLDGANAWQRFWAIRFPMIRSTIAFLCLINALYACFDTFPLIDILTAGGPGNQTTTLLYKIYQDGFLGMDWSSAAVQSLLLTIGVMLFGAMIQGHQKKAYAC